MNYADYSLTLSEYQQYKNTKTPQKLQEIWEDILKRLESEDKELAKEAREKGFEMISNPDMEDDIIAEYNMIIVPNASKELQEAWFEKLYPFIVCLKEEEEEEEYYY